MFLRRAMACQWPSFRETLGSLRGYGSDDMPQNRKDFELPDIILTLGVIETRRTTQRLVGNVL